MANRLAGETVDALRPSLRRLKWLGVLGPVAFIAAVDLARHTVEPGLLHEWPGHLVVVGVLLAGAVFFSEAIFRVVGRVQESLAQRNRELLALHDAGLAIAGELGLEPVLQKVVDTARELVGARYGALSILQEGGGVQIFLTTGISAEERARIGALPAGRGLLGVVLNEGQRLRLADLSRDPRSVGFPPNHPPMRSLLAVPIFSRGAVVGNLYMTEKEGASEFSTEDEETLARFATQGALAIENARLHRQVQAVAITEERERIAREMHDSLAQVLGYVNTKAQAAQGFLQAGRVDKAEEQIGQLADAARAAYSDVRESILGLRTSVSPDQGLLDGLREYVERWQEQSGVAVELVASVPEGFSRSLPPAAEVQILRIVQEGLANVRKHAHASRAWVHLREVDQWLEATVEDDGTGFDPSALGRGMYPRFGLATMRERAEAVGGQLTIESVPGRGTRLTARIPTVATTPVSLGGVDARADRR